MTSLGFEAKSGSIFQMLSDMDADGSGAIDFGEWLSSWPKESMTRIPVPISTKSSLFSMTNALDISQLKIFAESSKNWEKMLVMRNFKSSSTELILTMMALSLRKNSTPSLPERLRIDLIKPFILIIIIFNNIEAHSIQRKKNHESLATVISVQKVGLDCLL